MSGVKISYYCSIVAICLGRIVSLHFMIVTILTNQQPVNDVTTRSRTSHYVSEVHIIIHSGCVHL